MKTTGDAGAPFLTLCYGQIPPDALWDEAQTGVIGWIGWWVSGINAGDTDEAPCLPEPPERQYPISIHEARRHFDPIVGRAAAGLLGVKHDVVVADWTLVPGTDNRWTPTLVHERHTLTIQTLSGRSRTWWGLPGHVVDRVTNAVNEYDDGPIVDDDGIVRKPRQTTITLDIPVNDDGDLVPGGGAVDKYTATIRIATIDEILTDVRRLPLTDDEMGAVLTKHDPNRKRH